MAHPPAYLVTGPAELLVHRRGERLVEELRAEGELEVVDVAGPDVKDAGLPDLRTASLFGTRRALMIRQANDLPADAARALATELEAGRLDATVILLTTSTGRIVKLAKVVKDLGGRIEEKPPPEFNERGWKDLIAHEFGRHDRHATGAAIDAVYAHAGTDVGVIAEKVAQACAHVPEGSVDGGHVEAVVTGHGSRGAFAVADATCRRDPEAALTLLRGALEAGDDPVLVLGALVYRLRTLVAVAGRLDPADAGLSISPGQARHLERDRKRFGPGELTRAYRVLADADADLKGGELPPELVIERAVATVATPAR